MEEAKNDNKDRKTIYEIIPLVIDALSKKGIGKDGTLNAYGASYKYRKIDDVYNTLSPIFAKNKIMIVPYTNSVSSCERYESKKGGTVVHVVLDIMYRMYDSYGSFIESRVLGEGSDSSDKAYNKAYSAAFKIFASQTFCIPFEATDSEQDHIIVYSKSETDQVKGLIDGIESGDVDAAAICWKQMPRELKQRICSDGTLNPSHIQQIKQNDKFKNELNIAKLKSTLNTPSQ